MPPMQPPQEPAVLGKVPSAMPESPNPQFQGIPQQFSLPSQPKNKRKELFFVLVLLFLVIVGGSAVFAFYKYGNFSDTPKKELQQDTQPIAVSKPRSHLIATVPQGLIISGSIWGPTQIGFSNDGNEVMYPALDINTKKGLLVRNSTSLGELILADVTPGTIDQTSSSVDGKRVNYIAIKIKGEFKSPRDITSKDLFMVINDIEQKYNAPDSSGPYTGVKFSADGKNYVYSLWNNKEKKAQIIFNNEEIFVAQIPQTVINGKFIPGFNAIHTTLTLDGKRIGTVSQNGLKQEVIIIDAHTKVLEKDPLVDSVLSDVIFSPDGTHYVYRAKNGNEEFMVLDGVAQSNFGLSGNAWPPVFSYDGKKVAYTTKRVAGTGKNTVQAINVSNGSPTTYLSEEFPLSEFIENSDVSGVFDDLNFNPNSATVYDKNRKNKFVLTMDMKKSDDPTLNAEFVQAQQTADMVKFSEIIDKMMLISVEINGKKLDRLFQFVGTPQFSEDGKYVSFGVRDGRELRWMVYDLASFLIVE